MSERRSSVGLAERPEATLAALAMPERDWEKMALAVEVRLAGVSPGSTDGALLAAPLPSEAGEPESASSTPMVSSGVRTQSLAELARQSLDKGGESDASIAKASLALAAQGRAQTEELAEKLRRSQASAAAAAGPVDVTDSVQAVEDAPAPAARVVTMAPAGAKLSGNQLGYWVGAGGALLALAAAVSMWLKPAPAPLIVTQVVEQKADKAPLAAPSEPEPKAVEPEALKAERASPSAPATAALAAAAVRAPSASPGSAAAAPSAGPAPDKIVLEDDAPAAPSAVAKAAPSETSAPPAAPSADPQMRPADNTASGSLPAKPSMGAVQSAMAGVMSSARRCVAGDTEASSALVVFASDGHVSSVTVSGGAAGKPAAACIQAALSRAKTQPFAESSFSFSATVRP